MARKLKRNPNLLFSCNEMRNNLKINIRFYNLQKFNSNERICMKEFISNLKSYIQKIFQKISQIMKGFVLLFEKNKITNFEIPEQFKKVGIRATKKKKRQL